MSTVLPNDAPQQPSSLPYSQKKKNRRFRFLRQCCKDFCGGMAGVGDYSDVGMGGEPTYAPVMKKVKRRPTVQPKRKVKKSPYADCGL
mmetsp:Transcript_10045/g.21202  ORF Transcript_10045/g.21202 Transcript_10045/m.21202 type:complete len:88 (+) Transcript_10045:91-354(+)